MAYIRLRIKAGSDTRELYKELKKQATKHCFCAGVRYHNDGFHDHIEMYDFCANSDDMRKVIAETCAKLVVNYIAIEEH